MRSFHSVLGVSISILAAGYFATACAGPEQESTDQGNQALTQLSQPMQFHATKTGFRPGDTMRLLDTRDLGGPVSSYRLTMPREVPIGGAAFINITVTGATQNGWLKAIPAGSSADSVVVSNINFAAGQTVCNSAVVRVGAGKAIDLVALAGVQTHVVIDFMGYFSEPQIYEEAGSHFYNSRSVIFDTADFTVTRRNGTKMKNDEYVWVDVPELGRYASAAFVDLEVSDTNEPGYISTESGAALHDGPRARTSNLNHVGGEWRRHGSAVVQLGDMGGTWGFWLYSMARTHLKVTTNGYFSGYKAIKDRQGWDLRLLGVPERIFDSRDGAGKIVNTFPLAFPRSGNRVGALINLTTTEADQPGEVFTYMPGTGPIPVVERAPSPSLPPIGLQPPGGTTTPPPPAFREALNPRRNMTGAIAMPGQNQANFTTAPFKDESTGLYSERSSHAVVDATGYWYLAQ